MSRKVLINIHSPKRRIALRKRLRMAQAARFEDGVWNPQIGDVVSLTQETKDFSFIGPDMSSKLAWVVNSLSPGANGTIWLWIVPLDGTPGVLPVGADWVVYDPFLTLARKAVADGKEED